MSLVLAVALFVPLAVGEKEARPPEANYFRDPCLSRCRRERRAARREARWEAHQRRVVRPYRGWLASVRACETRGQPRPYMTNTGNGFYGAYQFTLSSWRAVGGAGMPHLAHPLEQDYRAVRLLLQSGAGNWPVCG